MSYHGTTLATTAVGGHTARKKGLAHVLETYPVAPTPYPLRCPLGPHHPDAGRYYVDALAKVIEAEGPETIAAFLAEPINGSSGGAIIPPDDYWKGVRALCDKHGILLILDEVMTGFGRTGVPFGFQHWGIEPDIFVSGKGLAGGYAPITGVFATSAVADPIAEAGMNVMFHTFGAHPAACAAACEVLRLLGEENLLQRCAIAGEVLQRRLKDVFGNHPNVAEVRGRGLLQAIEIVKNRTTLEPFDVSANITNRVIGAALKPRRVLLRWRHWRRPRHRLHGSAVHHRRRGNRTDGAGAVGEPRRGSEVTIKDRLAIQDLVAAYGDAVVRHDGDAWSSLWTKDAVWLLGETKVEGRDAIYTLGNVRCRAIRSPRTSAFRFRSRSPNRLRARAGTSRKYSKTRAA